MKGLDLCRRFYETYGEPMIKEGFSSCRHRIAAGMAGEGSDCLGFDDALSMDHDWGPGFCLWLTDEDYEDFGPRLQAAYDKLPRVFMGYHRKSARHSNQKTGVFRTSEFYRRFTGLAHAPETQSQWMNLCDAYLCACTSGEVFSDPMGGFSKIRTRLLEFYPEDVRRFKIAVKCATCAQSGQYNHFRSARREETVAASFAKHYFCLSVMDLVFLLKKRFAPFYKWKHRALKDLDDIGKKTYGAVAAILIETDDYMALDLMENLCQRMVDEIKAQGLSKASGHFLLDHGLSVRQSIEDETLRQREVFSEC